MQGYWSGVNCLEVLKSKIRQDGIENQDVGSQLLTCWNARKQTTSFMRENQSCKFFLHNRNGFKKSGPRKKTRTLKIPLG
jgi:hypothetical protein